MDYALNNAKNGAKNRKFKLTLDIPRFFGHKIKKSGIIKGR